MYKFNVILKLDINRPVSNTRYRYRIQISISSIGYRSIRLTLKVWLK